MIDGLEEMRRADRLDPEALERLVAINPQTLMTMLEADDHDRRRSVIDVGRARRSRTRLGYVGAMVAAAAAVIGGFFLLGRTEAPTDVDQLESAGQPANTSTSVAQDNGVPSVATVGSSDAASSLEAGLDEPLAPTVAPAPDPMPDPNLQEEEPGLAEVTTTAAPEDVAPSEPADPSTTASTQATTTTTAPTIEGPFNRSFDLLAVHTDYAHLDDGHANVAALEIATSMGLDPFVVAGTGQPDSDDGHDYRAVMSVIWGTNWLDAGVDRAGAVERAAARWLVTLDAGGRVWIAEGGAADFSADVVREIQRRRPTLDTRASIRMVQHSDHSEAASKPESLSFVKANTTYERVDDGNDANGTADLNQRTAGFRATALGGRHGAGWSAAFELLPAARLDFSDTVELLHILGIGTDEVADPNDFADRFMR